MSLTFEQLISILIGVNCIGWVLLYLTVKAVLKNTEAMVRDTLSIRVGYVVENKYVTFHNPPDGGSKIRFDYDGSEKHE